MQTRLKKSIEQYEKLERFFAEFPSRRGDYDLSAFDQIRTVVITPQPMYLAEPLLSRETLPGLRTFSGFEEFRDWLHRTS